MNIPFEVYRQLVSGFITISIIGSVIGLTLYILSAIIMRDSNGFGKALYNWLEFKFLIAERVFKAMYAMEACTMTLLALFVLFKVQFKTVGDGLLIFLAILIGGNLLLRIVYECLVAPLASLRILRRTRDEKTNNSLAKYTPTVQAYTPGAGKIVCRNCANSFDASLAVCPHCGRAKNM